MLNLSPGSRRIPRCYAPRWETCKRLPRDAGERLRSAGVPGLLFHDLRPTAARNLRRAGIAEGVIMKIGGWRTRSVFERYAVVSQTDIADALKKLERA